MIECAEGMEKVGWEAKLIGPEIFGGELIGINAYRVALKEYLLKEADQYDVIEYEHNRIIEARSVFPSRPLMVGRVSIFSFRDDLPQIPRFSGFKRTLSRSIRSFFKRGEEAREKEMSHQSILNAELLNVANEADRLQMIRKGVDPKRIVVFPYGICERRRPLFDQIESAAPREARVVFIGTFDERKGGVDLPRIFSRIQKRVPNIKFRLLGTAGMFQTKAEVRGFFPSQVQANLEVIPRYQPEELMGYLADCSIGVFPSYFESFGFGVLEMLAASIPVIAYRAPGPPMMLKEEGLVNSGDWRGMADKAVQWLSDFTELERLREIAKERSQEFDWNLIAQRTGDCYLQKINRSKTEKNS